MIVFVPGDKNRVVTFERQCSFFTVALDMAAELQTGANKTNVTEGEQDVSKHHLLFTPVHTCRHLTDTCEHTSKHLF